MYKPESQCGTEKTISSSKDTDRDDAKTKAPVNSERLSSPSHQAVRPIPLGVLVASHLRSKRQGRIDYSTEAELDQGLLLRVLCSVATTLDVESALKLAQGLRLPSSVVFEAMKTKDVDKNLL